MLPSGVRKVQPSSLSMARVALVVKKGAMVSTASQSCRGWQSVAGGQFVIQFQRRSGDPVIRPAAAAEPVA
jgi:hypothetical protein